MPVVSEGIGHPSISRLSVFIPVPQSSLYLILIAWALVDALFPYPCSRSHLPFSKNEKNVSFCDQEKRSLPLSRLDGGGNYQCRWFRLNDDIPSAVYVE